MSETYCQDCDHVHPATRGDPPWKWRCLKAPVRPGFRFVSKDWAPHPPYAQCEYRNPDGECDDFAVRREAPKVEAE